MDSELLKILECINQENLEDSTFLVSQMIWFDGAMFSLDTAIHPINSTVIKPTTSEHQKKSKNILK